MVSNCFRPILLGCRGRFDARVLLDHLKRSCCGPCADLFSQIHISSLSSHEVAADVFVKNWLLLGDESIVYVLDVARTYDKPIERFLLDSIKRILDDKARNIEDPDLLGNFIKNYRLMKLIATIFDTTMPLNDTATKAMKTFLADVGFQVYLDAFDKSHVFTKKYVQNIDGENIVTNLLEISHADSKIYRLLQNILFTVLDDGTFSANERDLTVRAFQKTCPNNINLDASFSLSLKNELPELIGCSLEGHTDRVANLLANGADPNVKDAYGLTALDWAAKNGNLEIAELLLKRGASPNSTDKSGYNSLHWAGHHGHKEIAQLLLVNGVDLNARTKNGQTALELAANQCHDAVTDLLAKNGCNINAENEDGKVSLDNTAQKLGNNVELRNSETQSRFFEACKLGKVERAIENWSSAPLESIIQFPHGSFLPMNPLDVAAENGKLHIVRFLCIHGSPPIHVSGSALLVAVKHNHIAIFSFFMEKYPHLIHWQNERGVSALHVAAQYGRGEITEMLLKNTDFEIDVVTNDKCETPLTLALANAHEQVALELLLAGSNGGHITSYKWTALMIACQHPSVKMLDILTLLAGCCDVDHKDDDGLTALSIACFNNHITAVEILINKGADVNCLDKDIATCLMQAAKSGALEVATALLNVTYLNVLNCRDRFCRTAFYYSMESGNLAFAKLLLEQGATLTADDRKRLVNSSSVDAELFGLVKKAVEMKPESRDTINPLNFPNRKINETPVHKRTQHECTKLNRETNLLAPNFVTSSPWKAQSKTPEVTNVKFSAENSSDLAEVKRSNSSALDSTKCFSFDSVKSQKNDSRVFKFIEACLCGDLDSLFANFPGELGDVYCCQSESHSLMTCLDVAVEQGHFNVVKFLCVNGRLPPDHFGSALLIAIKQKNSDIFYYLTNKFPECATWRNKRGITPLHVAAQYGHLQFTKHLLSNKSLNINEKDLGKFETPLFVALKNSHEDVAAELVSNGADCGIINVAEWTALMIACQSPSITNCDLFNVLAKYCDIEHKDNDGLTALAIACFSGHEIAVEFLIDRGANVNCLDVDGTSGFVQAAKGGYVKIAELLMRSKLFDKRLVNLSDVFGRTALMYAAEVGSIDLVKLLIENHADVNICDILGKCASDLAGNNAEIVELLHTYRKGSIELPNRVSKTKLEIVQSQILLQACYQGDVAGVEQLLSGLADLEIARLLSSASDHDFKDIPQELIGKTPFEVAVISGQKDMIALFDSLMKRYNLQH